MRLWHSKLIPLLDGRRLCDVHMSCCNLRGKGWGKRNAAVGYLYDDPLGEDALAVYHMLVLNEMEKRGYKVDQNWWRISYCGKKRPSRHVDMKKYEEALKRGVPLKGHTLQIYLNDVTTLVERGLPIRLSCDRGFDEYGPYKVYSATCGGDEIRYGVRITGGHTND